ADLMDAPDEEGFYEDAQELAEGQEGDIDVNASICLNEADGGIILALDYLKRAYREENMQSFLDMFVRSLWKVAGRDSEQPEA
ncbi:MAG: hypothetical protein IJU93_08810, partial [Lachnospiraceae bacterium]|nr:hypothetical protein [Lachnospiraceae bacterium]